jgi:hypothetical protein
MHGLDLDPFHVPDPLSDSILPLFNFKLRVPSCPALEHSNLCWILRPYELSIQRLESILLWHRPIHFAILLILVELFFLVAVVYSIGSLAVIAVLVAVTVILCFFFRFQDSMFITLLFPPLIPSGSPNASNRIRPIEDIAYLVAIAGSRLHCFYVSVTEMAGDTSFVGRILWILFLTSNAAGCSVIPSSVLFAMFFNVIVILPGIVFHPWVYPTSEPILCLFMDLMAPTIGV